VICCFIVCNGVISYFSNLCWGGGILQNFFIINFIPVHPLLWYAVCCAGDVVSGSSGTLCQVYVEVFVGVH
jgi:hypothetical protein